MKTSKKSNNKIAPYIRFIASLIVLSLLAWFALFDGFNKTEAKLDDNDIKGNTSIGFIGSADAMNASIDNSINAGITSLKSDGGWEPSKLVSSFSASDDKLTWTAKFNPDIRWSNGDGITLDDIMRSLQSTLNNGSYGSYISTNLESVKSDSASNSIVFKLKHPMAVLPWLLADPEYAIKPLTTANATGSASANNVSSGAYTITSTADNGSNLTLTANKYYNASQKSGVISMHAYASDADGLKALSSGEVGYLVKDSDIDYNAYSVDMSKYDVNRGNSTRRTMLVYNGRLDVSKPILSDQHFRLGLTRALDANAIMGALGNQGVVNHTPVVPGSYGYHDDNSAYSYNPDEGRFLSTSYFGSKNNRLLWQSSRGHAFGEIVDDNLKQILQYTKWDEVDDNTYNQRIDNKDYDIALVDMTGLDGFKDMLNGNTLTSIDDQPAVSDAYDNIFKAADDNALKDAINNAAIAEADASMADWLFAHRTTIISVKKMSEINPDFVDVNMMLAQAGSNNSNSDSE